MLRLLAEATLTELKNAYDALPEQPEAMFLRAPETGLVMVRGRIGGGGDAFNLGEVTVTRATCRLENGLIGHAHALGTGKEKARLAAIFDALAQAKDAPPQVEALFSTIEARLIAEESRTDEQTAATKVNFFTMVRGED